MPGFYQQRRHDDLVGRPAPRLTLACLGRSVATTPRMPDDSDTGDAFAAFERAGWESGRASPYHRALGVLTARPIPALLDAAAVGPGSAALDVATCPGYAAALAAERGAKVVAVDLSREMLDLAAELHPAIEFRQADANALPFEDATFDAVVSNLLMPHVSDLPAVVVELARVVRSGGRVALTTCCRPSRRTSRRSSATASRSGWRAGAAARATSFRARSRSAPGRADAYRLRA
jgi:SAM-dependent methyltransferase